MCATDGDVLQTATGWTGVLGAAVPAMSQQAQETDQSRVHSLAARIALESAMSHGSVLMVAQLARLLQSPRARGRLRPQL